MRLFALGTIIMAALAGYDVGQEDWRAVANVLVIWAIIGACVLIEINRRKPELRLSGEVVDPEPARHLRLVVEPGPVYDWEAEREGASF